MTRYDTSRAGLPLALLLGLLSACANAGQQSPGAAQPAPDADVTAEDIEREPHKPIEQLLTERVPGARVVRTADGGIAVRIRGGSSSLMGNNEPLYVVDGLAIEPGPGGGLAGVNPHDIASIEVLTDPADTSMYGIRGANGVVVIRMKRGGQ